MSMQTQNPTYANKREGLAYIYFGTAGVRPNTHMGLTTADGVRITDASEYNTISTYGDFPYKSVMTAKGAKAAFTLQEVSDASLGEAYTYLTRSGNLLEATSTETDKTISLLWQRSTGTTTYEEVWIPYCSQSASAEMREALGIAMELSFEFEILKQSNTLPPWTKYNFSELTLASDSAAKTSGKNCFVINGQGGAVDDLSTITGGTEDDSIVLVAGGYTITVKHAPGASAFTLAAETDFTLTANNGATIIRFTHDGTGWVEDWNALSDS